MWHGLYIVAALAIVSVLAVRWAASRRPIVADPQGWFVIRVGPGVYALTAATTAFSLLLFYIWLFVGTSLPNADEEMLACVLTAAGFMIISVLLLMSGTWRKVRWKDQSLEVAPMIGRPHRYKFNELQSVTCRLNAAEFLLRFDGGRPVKLSVMMNGTRELLEDLGNPMVDYED